MSESASLEEKSSVVQHSTTAAAKLKSRAEELRERAESNRQRIAAIDIALAFRVFLFLVPLAFVFVAGFGLAADASGQDPTDLASHAGIVGLLASSITTVGDQSLWGRITIFVVGGFALLIGARTLMKVLFIVHVLVWRLPRVKLRKQPQLIGGLLLAVVLSLVLIQFTSKLRDRSFLAWVLALALFVAVPTGIWLFAALRVFPHPPGVGWRDVLPGAILVGVGLEFLHVFTVVWITREFESKSETYGAIGGSLALLLWAYVIGRILAGSVTLNAVIWNRSHQGGVLPPPPPPARLP